MVDTRVGGGRLCRPRLFTPMLMGVEQEWLDELEKRELAVLVPRAIAALEMRFGRAFRIESGRAEEVLAEIGYVLSPSPLFDACVGQFSTQARQKIRHHLASLFTS